jgi:hypothetical protein
MRQDDEDLSRRVLLSEPGRKRPRGRPTLRWEDGVVEDVARLGRRNWKVIALNRERWRKLLKEAEVHPGLQSRCRERGPTWAVAPERERETERERGFQWNCSYPSTKLYGVTSQTTLILMHIYL